MPIKNARTIAGVESPHGEVVNELIGAAAGGSLAHSLAQIVIRRAKPRSSTTIPSPKRAI